MNVWWCNQTRCWIQELDDGIVRASDHMQRLTYRETVGEAKKGDIIVHYRKPFVYAVSRAKENGKYKENLPEGYWSGWEFKTGYFPLEKPIHREDFRESLVAYADKYYAINPNGWVKQGYFLRFDVKGLKVIRSKIPSKQRPDWLKVV